MLRPAKKDFCLNENKLQLLRMGSKYLDDKIKAPYLNWDHYFPLFNTKTASIFKKQTGKSLSTNLNQDGNYLAQTDHTIHLKKNLLKCHSLRFMVIYSTFHSGLQH
jgi:hypothetical protein